MAKRPRVPWTTRYRTSRTIFKQSLEALGRERDLWVFPILSGLLLILAVGGLIGLASGASAAGWFGMPWGLTAPWGQILVGLAVLPLFYPVAVLSSALNAALAYALFLRASGSSCTRRGAWQAARRCLGPIARFNVLGLLVAGVLQVVGQLLESLRLVPFLGRVTQTVGTMAWAVASFFVFPVLVLERERSALGALRESADMARSNWGKAIGGMVTLSLAILVPMLALAAAGALASAAVVPLLVAWDPPLGVGIALLVVPWLLVLLGVMALSMLQQAALTSYQTALYRYTRFDEITAPYTRATLVDAWGPYRSE